MRESIFLLDQGYVRMEGWSGSDLDIAKWSGYRGQALNSPDPPFYAALVREGALAPLQMARATFRIRAPVRVTDGWFGRTQPVGDWFTLAWEPTWREVLWGVSLLDALRWVDERPRVGDTFPDLTAYVNAVDFLLEHHWPRAYGAWHEARKTVRLTNTQTREIRRALKGRSISASLAKVILEDR